MELKLEVLLLFIHVCNVASKLSFSDQFEKKKPAPLRNNSVIEEKWFTQFLDHYDLTEARSWHQRYYLDEQYYKSNGPIFLMLGGSAPATPEQLANSFVAYLAQRFGAKCFLLEHRFYGASQPSPDLSSESLAYLSVEQVLGDVANFIEETGTRADKWLVFGSSYAGSLAAWTRLKYPHLVRAAVADGAPLLARVDFADYYGSAERLYRKHSAECADALAGALGEAHASLFDAAGQDKLRRLFNLCEPIGARSMSGRDAASLFGRFLDVSVLPATAGAEDSSPRLPELCAILLDERRGPLLNRLAASFDLVLEYNNASCLLAPDYAHVLASYRDAELTEEAVKRQRLHRACRELGWFASTSARPFGLAADCLPVSFFEGLCADVFGPGSQETLKRAVERTNTVYGARDLQDATSRIVFVSGDEDPWSSLEISQCDNPEITCIRIQGAGCSSLQYPPSNNDTPQIIEAKKVVAKQISQWLN